LVAILLCSGTGWSPSGPVQDQDNLPGGADALFFQYRLFIRNLLDRRCSFSPSCSHIGQQAIARHGPVFGTMIALERWMRCNSLARSQDYYVHSGHVLSDPLEIDEGLVIWDSLLLPF